MKTKESPAITLRNRILKANNLGAVTSADYGENSEVDATAYIVPYKQAVMGAVGYLSIFPRVKATAIRRALREMNLLREEDRAPHFNIYDIYLAAKRGVRKYNQLRPPETQAKQATREVDALFDGDIGSITVPEKVNFSTPAKGTNDQVDATAAFARFYLSQGRVFAPKHGAMELRGPNYFVSFKEAELPEKLEIIRGDMRAAGEVISSVNRGAIDSYQYLLPYMGVYDYMKNGAELLLHGVTYHERFFDLGSSMGKGYKEIRERSYELTRQSVRRFYQTILGLPYDKPLDAEMMNRDVDDILDFLKKRGKDEQSVARRSKRPHQGLSYPEVNHPLVIALAGFEAVRQNPQADILMGVPSGGTEMAFLMQLLYELQGKKVDTIQVPFSHRLLDNPQRLRSWMDTIYGKRLKDRNVVITEDASSTGTTVMRLMEAVDQDVQSINPAFVEFDGRRLTGSKISHLFNPAKATTAMGITGVEGIGTDFFVLKGVNSIRHRLDSPTPIPFKKKA